MSLDAVIGALQMVEAALEDMWIAREILCWHLRQLGYTDDDLTKILTAARSDPALRERSRAAYAEMRESLEKAVREEAIEGVL